MLGLQGRGHEPLASFSGGWQRHIEIVATLIHHPTLIILDEPTTGLDAPARERIWALIDARRLAGAAVIYTSHDAAEMARADRCIHLPLAEPT